MSSVTHFSLGLVHLIRPLLMVNLGVDGENRSQFHVRPCVILNQFRFDVDVGLVRVYLHHSEEVAASIGHLPPVVYDLLLNLGPHFFHIFHTTVVICH